MRRTRWVRRQSSLKPQTDTGSVDVDATVISVKDAHYPGRSADLRSKKKKKDLQS